MAQPIEAKMRQFEKARALDRIAIPLIPTVGVEAAYKIAIERKAPKKRDMAAKMETLFD